MRCKRKAILDGSGSDLVAGEEVWELKGCVRDGLVDGLMTIPTEAAWGPRDDMTCGCLKMANLWVMVARDHFGQKIREEGRFGKLKKMQKVWKGNVMITLDDVDILATRVLDHVTEIICS